ncbi:MAG: hypothetical protein R3D97_16975 [Paracoccaceae bacterium]
MGNVLIRMLAIAVLLVAGGPGHTASYFHDTSEQTTAPLKCAPIASQTGGRSSIATCHGAGPTDSRPVAREIAVNAARVVAQLNRVQSGGNVSDRTALRPWVRGA